MLVLGRKKDDDSTSLPTPDSGESDEQGAVGKGRPTPKRREAEAKNRRPLVVNDRKAAKAQQRKANMEARAKMDQAMRTGDERHMPAQHQGSQRRYVRDYVDARWSLGEFFLPIALIFVVLVLVFGNNPQFAFPLLVLLYGIVFVALIDAILLGRRLRKKLVERYGKENLQRGIVMYAVLRAFQLRATRMPKPQVKRGEYPAL